MNKLAVRALTAAGLVCAIGANALADLSTNVFTIEARVGNQVGTFIATQDQGYWDWSGNFYWTLDGDVDITDGGGNVLATLTGASVTVLHDPVVALNFNVQAANQNTVFTVGSGLLSFSQLSNPVGAASAGVTVTDVNGNGATLSPDGTTMYTSRYNGDFPGGTTFADLLGSSLSAGAFQSNSTSEEFPGGGNFVNVGSPVSSMSAGWTFSLSAFDLATGTSTFVVVPTPAGLALLGCAGLVATRRRR